MLPLVLALPLTLMGPAEMTAAPEVQKPTESPPDATAPADPGTPEDPDATDADVSGVETAADAPAEQQPEPEVEKARAPAKPTRPKDVPVERDGPPFYTKEDSAKLAARYDIPAKQPTKARKARLRCLIADPTCGFNFEVNATSAYAHRFRQGDVSAGASDVNKWASGRAQYDLWLNIPALVETVGDLKFTRMTIGPKGGVIASDTGDLYGNLGFATRYWLGRGKWAPTIELTSALSFKVYSRSEKNLGGADPKFEVTRSPVGFTADIGVGLGGFGAIVFGGQYDSPLAREDVPESLRVSAGGMIFVGFRGNIIWGAPAAAAVTTHALTQRLVEQP